MCVNLAYSDQHLGHYHYVYVCRWSCGCLLSPTAGDSYIVRDNYSNWTRLSIVCGCYCIQSSSAHDILAQSDMGRGQPGIPTVCTEQGIRKFGRKDSKKREMKHSNIVLMLRVHACAGSPCSIFKLSTSRRCEFRATVLSALDTICTT